LQHSRNISSSKAIKFVENKVMETIVVQPSNDEELKLLKEFLQKSCIKNRVLNEEDKEDLVLGLMMQETDYSDIIDTNEFIKQLQGK
jgi:hypothetical protein